MTKCKTQTHTHTNTHTETSLKGYNKQTCGASPPQSFVASQHLAQSCSAFCHLAPASKILLVVACKAPVANSGT